MEIEKKYAVARQEFLNYIDNNPSCVIKILQISQYYIPALDGTFRLRRTRNPDNSFSFVITLKKFVSKGENEEIEVYIDSNTAYEIINAIKDIKSLKKTRYKILYEQRTWEVDLFENDMVLAEIELNYINEPFPEPSFLREDVTGDKKFTNEYIATYLNAQ